MRMSCLVKICGLTNRDDAYLALEAGADLLGFVFAPGPRQVHETLVARIMKTVRRAGRQFYAAGVFLQEPLDQIAGKTHRAGLDIIQLHGWGTPEECAILRNKGFQVSRVFRVKDESSLNEVAAFDVDYVHLDTYDPSLPGGTGATFDYRLIKNLAKEKRLILAGGLTPENVAQAVREVRPYAVDVSSGVEGAIKGVKDRAKIEQFIIAAKTA